MPTLKPLTNSSLLFSQPRPVPNHIYAILFVEGPLYDKVPSFISGQVQVHLNSDDMNT